MSWWHRPPTPPIPQPRRERRRPVPSLHAQPTRPPVQFLAVGLPTGPVAEPLAGKVRIDGRFWVNDAGTYRPRYLSGFKLPALAVQDPQRMTDYLDMAVNLGFNGVRILAGRLTWGPQSVEEVYAGLPLVLEEARLRNLSLEVTVFSDSKAEDDTHGDEAYDLDAHMTRIAAICAPFQNLVGEVANEPYHGSQAERVHVWSNLTNWGQDFEANDIQAWAQGAPITDEPSPDPASPEYVNLDAPYITLHLDRGRDEWNMVRRVRELENVSNGYDKPAMNNEPIGWAEVDEPGRRSNNPNIAFTMGALSRGFEVGLVSHADHGLECDPPGPNQIACHEAAVAGFKVFGTDARLRFENAGWATSPIKSAAFEVTVVRCYSFMDRADHGWTVLVGLTGDPGIVWQNGFGPVAIVADHPATPEHPSGGVQVLEVAKVATRIHRTRRAA